MLYRPRQHIGNRLDPPMWVPREPLPIARRVVISEIIEQQKRVGVRRIAKPERSTQVDAGTFELRLRLGDSADRS